MIELNLSLGSAYNNPAIVYSEITQPILELEYMKIAAQLGVDKAIEWINQKCITLQ